RSPQPSPPGTRRCLSHGGCLVERIVINRTQSQMALESQPNRDARAFSVIKSAFLPIDDAYALRVSEAEYFYIYELL
ncbi:PRD domain-containing protein, partial [Salmonella enterica subsp. enterica serovar Infantis]